MVGDYSRESKAEKDISLLKRGAWGPPGNETQVGGGHHVASQDTKSLVGRSTQPGLL